MIKEEFCKSYSHGFLRLLCSFPVLSEIYNLPLLLKNAINIGFHENEIEAETDPEIITQEKEKLKIEKSYADKIVEGKTVRDFYFEDLPQAYLQLRNLYVLIIFRYRYQREFARLSYISMISPFVSIISIGFTSWKIFMCGKKFQDLSILEIFISLLPMTIYSYVNVFIWTLMSTLSVTVTMIIFAQHYFFSFTGYFASKICPNEKNDWYLIFAKENSLICPQLEKGRHFWLVAQIVLVLIGMVVFIIWCVKQGDLAAGGWFITHLILFLHVYPASI